MEHVHTILPLPIVELPTFALCWTKANVDAETLEALAKLGWRATPFIDMSGQPYLAFQRGGDYFHVVTDSRTQCGMELREYDAGARVARFSAQAVVQHGPAVGPKVIAGDEEAAKAKNHDRQTPRRKGITPTYATPAPWWQCSDG